MATGGTIQIGLIDMTHKLDKSLLQQVATALTIQAIRDLPPFWGTSASVQVVGGTHALPIGMWPIFLVARLPPGEGGFHLDKHNQPYAKVIATPDSDGWTVAASHELIEMLVDPYGNRLQTSRSIEIAPGGEIQDGDSEFDYLVEACDPCEADAQAYTIRGVAVSDFITPHFYDPVVSSSVRYSFTGAITRPRQILPGGYISWVDHTVGRWRQLQFIDPNSPPKIVDLGPADAKSLREWVHTKAPQLNELLVEMCVHPGNEALFAGAHGRRRSLDEIAGRRMAHYVEHLGAGAA